MSINIQKGVLVKPRNALEKGKASIQTTNFNCKPLDSFLEVALRCCVEHRIYMSEGSDDHGCQIIGGLHSFNNKGHQKDKTKRG